MNARSWRTLSATVWGLLVVAVVAGSGYDSGPNVVGSPRLGNLFGADPGGDDDGTVLFPCTDVLDSARCPNAPGYPPCPATFTYMYPRTAGATETPNKISVAPNVNLCTSSTWCSQVTISSYSSRCQ